MIIIRIIGEKVQPTVVSELLYSFSRDFGQRGTYVEVGSYSPMLRWDIDVVFIYVEVYK